MASNNSSSAHLLSSNFERQYELCMGFGLGAIITNILIAVVFLSTSRFRQQYQMFIALAIGECFNGAAFFLTGFLRTGTRRTEQPATAMECMLKPWIIPLIIGSQLPALCTFALSVERYMAVSWPFWYRTTWTHSKQQLIIIGCFLSTALSTAAAFFSATQYGDQIRAPKGTCFLSQATGPFYSSVHFALVIVLHSFAFVINVYALCVGTRKSAHRAGAVLIQAEATRIKLILIISAFSVLLVAIPNTLLWALILKLFPLDTYTALQQNFGYVFVLFSANSAINLAVYLCLSRDFRSRIIEIVNVGPLFKSIPARIHSLTDRVSQ